MTGIHLTLESFGLGDHNQLCDCTMPSSCSCKINPSSHHQASQMACCVIADIQSFVFIRHSAVQDGNTVREILWVIQMQLCLLKFNFSFCLIKKMTVESHECFYTAEVRFDIF